MPTPSDFFQIQTLERTKVIELMLPGVLDSSEFDRLNESMLDLIRANSEERWIIDLSRVYYMGSAMLGLMVNLRQRVKSAGGRLVLCSVPPSLLEIFRTCCMERLFVITKTRADALKA